jgi:aryl-alcohol dehydrogenase-like predicted oxidoreductase
MSFPPKPPRPTSLLGYHRILSPTAAIRVSPLCLGAMNFGNAWSPFMGECTKSTTFAILDTFHQQGGNFIDTANMYQFGESERWIGEWMAERGNRDEIVLATKFGSPTRYGESMGSNFAGNSRKNLRLAVQGSLERLGTGYIDLLWVHAWDFTASVEEMMVCLSLHPVRAKRPPWRRS